MKNISATQIKEVREITEAGIMDCKKALIEINGNLEPVYNLANTP